MWFLLWKKCWYHTRKISWYLPFVLQPHHMHTCVCSFAYAVLFTCPLFCVSTPSSSYFKVPSIGLWKKNSISECQSFLFQTHVRSYKLASCYFVKSIQINLIGQKSMESEHLERALRIRVPVVSLLGNWTESVLIIFFIVISVLIH